MNAPSLPPFRPLRMVEPRVSVTRRANGEIILENPYRLLPVPANVIEPFRIWAAAAPDRVWLAERPSPGAPWRICTYAEALDAIARIASGLLALSGGAPKPLMILSGNSINHALLSYGAILAGMPVAPLSRAYSLMSSDFARLDHCAELVEPGFVFADDGVLFEKALKRVAARGARIIHEKRAAPGADSIAFAQLLTHAPDAAEGAYARLSHDSVAKFLFTSGSTGMPKAVINTHRMMCTNAVMARSLLADPEGEEPSVSLSWLPWNHTFGGNAVLNGMTTSGGTLYLDGGLPQPGLFDETLRNLAEISPTSYSNVPAAYAMLIPALERDDALAATFFRKLRGLAYGGAALSQDLYDRIQKVAIRHCGERLSFSSGYGATETGPTIMNVHWPTARMGLLGLPLPGVAIKLVPQGGKMEVRAKGDCITPGYHKRPDLSAKAFDDEGFYSLGDAAKFVDPDDPAQGLVFDGRVAEDFKLETGTWVNAGRLRVQAIEAAGGLLQDALVAGLDRAYAAILGWPNLAACRAATGNDRLSFDEVVTHPQILSRIAAGLTAHNKVNPGSSTQIRRALLMVEPPSLDAGEITDKGYVNQSLSLARRKALVEKLYTDPPGNDVIAV
ncbi:MAG TPA: AMP-binding protein [Micropepsaceae bacterium]|nr:AMP-binding protein [Micropepsaceae bacterium]